MKFAKYILILVMLTGLFGSMKVGAQTLAINSTTGYQLLAPLPDPDKNNNELLETIDPKGLGSYLNPMIKILIGFAAVLSVVMIVVGGLEYMTSELISSKEEGKKRILGAIFGLLLALGAYALLFTINPDLLKSDPSIPETVAPAPQPANWYFEYKSASARRNFINGAYTKPVCISRSSSILRPDTIVRPCFQSNTRPIITPNNDSGNLEGGGGRHGGAGAGGGF